MKPYYYDLHIHSCLSPCGDGDSTPNNIAGMAKLSELDIVALTDHNTTKNCPAFFEAAERLGIIPVAGMELTSSEDIHIVCLFEHLEDAMRFDEYVSKHRTLIKNRPEFFGEQLILDGEDEPLGIEEYLLTNATDISSEDAVSLVSSFGGIAYPAHIDRDSNGIIAILGTIPEDTDFRLFELRDGGRKKEFKEKYGIAEENFIVSSDAHSLESMRDKENYFILPTESFDSKTVRKELFSYLGKLIGKLA